MRIELTRVDLQVYLGNHYTTRGAPDEIIVSEFELQLRFYIYIHFRANTLSKGMNLFSFPALC